MKKNCDLEDELACSFLGEKVQNQIFLLTKIIPIGSNQVSESI
jgi:hypothetical protein